MDLQSLIMLVSSWMVSWPLMLYVIGISIICTIALRGIQFRYFLKAWRVTLRSNKDDATSGDMTPSQAFINTLSASLGNGVIGGVATAIYAGGPGSAFWMVFFGLLLMSIRFAEVYLSVYFGAQEQTDVVLGGPMLYLKRIFAGNILAFLYAIFCFLFSLSAGNAVQANSISVSLAATWGIAPIISACSLFLFIMYVVFGGASRIVKLSDRIVPIKVALFFVSSCIVLVYHAHTIWPALKIIFASAFNLHAFAGGVVGFSIQQAIRYGMIRSIFATESGLGTAAVLFGFTGSKDPVSAGFMGMLSTFISTCVCFVIALCIVASGVWNTGLNSTALTIASFNTVFGNFGGWIVSFLSISFGIGVLITFAYISRATWFVITKGKYDLIFVVLYCLVTFFGALLEINVVWHSSDIINACMLIINLLGILCLLPVVRKGVINIQ